MIVEPRDVIVGDELPGRVRASRLADIRPRLSAIVVQRTFSEGGRVREGDVLYRLDQAPFLAAVRKTEADLAVARSTADRDRAALRAGLARLEAGLRTAQAEVDDDRQAVAAGEAEIRRAEAALEIARIDLADTQIIAPIGGTIVRSSAAEGSVVTPCQPNPMATIQELDPISVDVTLPSGPAGVGDSGPVKVRLTMDDGTTYAHDGTLDVRDVTIDPATGMAIVRAQFANPEGLLRPGMYVWAFVRRGIVHQGIAIPNRAMQRDSAGTPHALVVDDQGTVAARALDIVGAEGGQWLVRSGLARGEQVIVDGPAEVRAGDVVHAVRVDPAARRI